MTATTTNPKSRTFGQKVMVPFHDLMHALATQPMLMRLSVMFIVFAAGMSDSLAQTGGGGGTGLTQLTKSFQIIMFIAMLVGGVLALVLFIQGGVAIKRGEEGYLHIIGGFIIGAAPAMTYYMMYSSGVTGAAFQGSDINTAASGGTTGQ